MCNELATTSQTYRKGFVVGVKNFSRKKEKAREPSCPLVGVWFKSDVYHGWWVGRDCSLDTTHVPDEPRVLSCRSWPLVPNVLLHLYLMSALKFFFITAATWHGLFPFFYTSNVDSTNWNLKTDHKSEEISADLLHTWTEDLDWWLIW